MITSTQFASVFGDRCEADNYESAVWAMAEFGIEKPKDQAGFLAQAAHESRLFTRLEESLIYGEKRLLEIWPFRFHPGNVKEYARQPEKLANFVYGNRLGNGSETSGDGWNYRGRGWFMLTGRGTYVLYSGLIGRPLIVHPQLLCTPAEAARSAAAYWKFNKLNGFADFISTTRAINGPGLVDQRKREALFLQLLSALES